MANFDSKYVKCPYYHRCDDNRICCEGVEAGTTVNIVFESPKKLKEYKQNFCFDLYGCHACLVCRMHDEKWEEHYGES